MPKGALPCDTWGSPAPCGPDAGLPHRPSAFPSDMGGGRGARGSTRLFPITSPRSTSEMTARRDARLVPSAYVGPAFVRRRTRSTTRPPACPRCAGVPRPVRKWFGLDATASHSASCTSTVPAQASAAHSHRNGTCVQLVMWFSGASCRRSFPRRKSFWFSSRRVSLDLMPWLRARGGIRPERTRGAKGRLRMTELSPAALEEARRVLRAAGRRMLLDRLDGDSFGAAIPLKQELLVLLAE